MPMGNVNARASQGPGLGQLFRREPDIDHQVAGDLLEFGPHGRRIQPRGKAERGPRLKNGFACHGSVGALCREFLHVDMMCGEGMGKRADDSRPVVADDFECCGSVGSRQRNGLLGFVYDNGQAKGVWCEKRLTKFGGACGFHLHPDDAGKVTAEMEQPTLQPVAPVGCDAGGGGFHQSWPISAKEGDDEG